MKIKEEDVRVSRLKLMTKTTNSRLNSRLKIQTQDSTSRLKLKTQNPNSRLKLKTHTHDSRTNIFYHHQSNQKGTNKAWMVSHDMMLTCHMHEGLPLELNPVLKLLEMHKGCWWAMCTTCVVSLSNEHMSRCDPFSTTMMMTTIMHKYIPVE